MMDRFQNNDENLKAKLENTLNRKQHIKQLINGLSGITGLNQILVPVQSWTVYWITHSLSILEQQSLVSHHTEDVIKFIEECAHPEGGYGGGPGQIAHLATTFAAVNALITTSSEAALDSIDRSILVRFLRRMKQPDGSFTMHDDGEIDSRATYCALAVLRCLNIQDCNLLENVADWILSCQTYEGGFGSLPGCEAHGGYTFCCVASLCFLNQFHRANLSSLLRWLTNKQLSDDGGFCGRSNKLVDSCYSFWQGAVFPLLHPYLKDILKISPTNSTATSFSSSSSSSSDDDDDDACSKESGQSGDKVILERRTTRSRSSRLKKKEVDKELKKVESSVFDNWIFDCAALQDYVLNQCQSKSGLLRDKPEASPDYYHTCYALSGLSISQHQPDSTLFDLGSQQINQLAPIHPLFNLTLENLDYCFNYFKDKKIETFEEKTNS